MNLAQIGAAGYSYGIGQEEMRTQAESQQKLALEKQQQDMNKLKLYAEKKQIDADQRFEDGMGQLASLVEKNPDMLKDARGMLEQEERVAIKSMNWDKADKITTQIETFDNRKAQMEATAAQREFTNQLAESKKADLEAWRRNQAKPKSIVADGKTWVRDIDKPDEGTRNQFDPEYRLEGEHPTGGSGSNGIKAYIGYDDHTGESANVGHGKYEIYDKDGTVIKSGRGFPEGFELPATGSSRISVDERIHGRETRIDATLVKFNERVKPAIDGVFDFSTNKMKPENQITATDDLELIRAYAQAMDNVTIKNDKDAEKWASKRTGFVMQEGSSIYDLLTPGSQARMQRGTRGELIKGLVNKAKELKKATDEERTETGLNERGAKKLPSTWTKPPGIYEDAKGNKFQTFADRTLKAL